MARPRDDKPGATHGRGNQGRPAGRATGPAAGRPAGKPTGRPGPGGPGGPVEHHRRSLANLGGEIEVQGDEALGPLLREALTLPEGFDERALTHGFHAWPARLHPHTARVLVKAAPPGAIADPFMGGGTTPLEARLAGRLAVGNDLNPVGLEVAWVRTRCFGKKALDELREATRVAIKLATSLAEERRAPPSYRDRVAYAFDPQALQEVWALGAVIDDYLKLHPEQEAWRVLRAALSSILVKVSRLVSDSVAKVDRSKAAFTPRGRVFHWFKGRVVELSDQIVALSRALPEGSPEPMLTMGDARTPPPRLPAIGAVVSSPPYPGIYDYVDHHRLRLLALGLPVAPMVDLEIGSRRESERSGLDVGLARYVSDLTRVLSGWTATLVPGGFVAFIIGDGQVGAKVTPVLPLLERAAKDSGLFIRAAASQRRPVFSGSGPAGKKGLGKAEHLAWLERVGPGTVK